MISYINNNKNDKKVGKNLSIYKYVYSINAGLHKEVSIFIRPSPCQELLGQVEAETEMRGALDERAMRM